MTWDGIDRRRFIRVEVFFPADINNAEKHKISTCVEELSEGGIKVALKEELKVSSVVDLEIYLREKPVVCKGKISWVKRVEADYLKDGVTFQTGIEIQDVKEEDKRTIKNIVVAMKRKIT